MIVKIVTVLSVLAFLDPPHCLPVLEERLQRLADSVPLLDGEQVLKLLAEGSPVDFDAWWENFRHPLQRAEGWRPEQLTRSS